MGWPPTVGETLPRSAECRYEQAKLDDWVLADRGHGREWRRVFHIGPEDSGLLWVAIAAASVEAPIATVRDRGEDGVVCGVEIELTIQGRTALATVSWHYEREGSAPRLVTAYPTVQYTYPEILVGIGEWLGVPDAARGMSRC